MSRLLVDENFPMRAWEVLAAAGHDVAAVGRDAPALDDEPEDALALVLGALAEQIDGAFVVVTAQGLRRRPF